jgi:hypothetical protein
VNGDAVEIGRAKSNFGDWVRKDWYMFGLVFGRTKVKGDAVRIGIFPPWGLVDRECWGMVLPEREVVAWALVG